MLSNKVQSRYPVFFAALIAGLLLPLMVNAPAHAQGGGPTQLQRIPDADLSSLETSVAEQLREARSLVDAFMSSPNPPKEELSDAFGNLGRLYHAYELLESAEICYLNAGALAGKKTTQWPYLFGVIKQKQGDIKKATNAFLYVLTIDNDHVPARIRLAQTHRTAGELELAKGALQTAAESQPDSALIAAERGEIALAEKDNEAAVKFLSDALAKVPAATRLHYPLALAYRNLKQDDKARQHMALRGEAGIAIDDPQLKELEELKTGERVHLLRGKLAFNARDYLSAARAFEAAIKAKPDSARAHVNLATALGILGDTPGAIKHYTRSLELEPDNGTAHFNLGNLHYQSGEFDKARTHLERGVALNPEDAEARLILARTLLRLNRGGEAFQQFKQVAKLDPSSVEAWMSGSQLLIGAQQYREAAHMLTFAHRNLPRDLRVKHALARILAGSPDLSVRDADQARPLAYQVYQAEPTLGHAYTVAMALGESGECEKAAGSLRQAMQNQPAEVREKYSAQAEKINEYYLKQRPCRTPPRL